ncbi:unnamed protein product [Paramecium sonneborni]|uniref:Transmembrane protein n=1 Tax=Paramecium sonneborni TaxID=65129 RepID=A0A8S1QIX3_9CILI|nr:unnamed protein product [Paramecium sonneborni]
MKKEFGVNGSDNKNQMGIPIRSLDLQLIIQMILSQVEVQIKQLHFRVDKMSGKAHKLLKIMQRVYIAQVQMIKIINQFLQEVIREFQLQKKKIRIGLQIKQFLQNQMDTLYVILMMILLVTNLVIIKQCISIKKFKITLQKRKKFQLREEKTVLSYFHRNQLRINPFYQIKMDYIQILQELLLILNLLQNIQLIFKTILSMGHQVMMVSFQLQPEEIQIRQFVE